VDKNKETSIEISVLLPTRGRTESLRRSIMSLVSTVSHPGQIEILLAFDNDDTSSSDWFHENISDLITKAGVEYTAWELSKMGYIRLNEYVNFLAGKSRGRWLMFWNDDAVMESQSWDQRISEVTEFQVLRIPTHRDHPYAIFPIVPRAWYDLFGYISAHQISDAWTSQMAYMLDIMQNIEVQVTHDRHDLTGNNKDSTFDQRVMLEGNPTDPRDFNHKNWRLRRIQDAVKICEMLEAQGRDMSWFRSVLKGTQDPWAKMCSPEYDPNRQLSTYK